MKLRNLGVALDENLTLKCHLAAVKTKAIGGDMDITKISKFIDGLPNLKIVHCLVLTKIDFYMDCQIKFCTVFKWF